MLDVEFTIISYYVVVPVRHSQADKETGPNYRNQPEVNAIPPLLLMKDVEDMKVLMVKVL